MSGSFAGFEGPGSGFGAFGGPGFGGPGFGGPGLGPGGPAGFGLRIKRAVTGSLLLDGPASAAQIVQRVSDATEGEILLPEPVVERVLERLAHKGVVTTEDGVATLTDFGRKVLAKRASPARRHRRSAPRSSPSSSTFSSSARDWRRSPAWRGLSPSPAPTSRRKNWPRPAPPCWPRSTTSNGRYRAPSPERGSDRPCGPPLQPHGRSIASHKLRGCPSSIYRRVAGSHSPRAPPRGGHPGSAVAARAP